MRKKICLKENQKDECVGKKMVPLCLQEEELLSEKVQGFLVPLKERKASKRERERERYVTKFIGENIWSL